MKSLLLFCCLCLAVTAMAEESSCPAQRAAQLGHTPFDAFHEVLSPVWHTAWPEKNYEDLLAAGPKFQTLFVDIAKMEPKFKSERRSDNYLKLRSEFADLVASFAAACEKSDKELAYEIMPKLHDAFELTASSLLPIHYPEFDGIVITLNLITESHLPANNIKGVKGSTETLVDKVTSLNEASLPTALQAHKKEIVPLFTKMKTTAAKMKECCDKDDMKQFKQHADLFSSLINDFIADYL